FCVGKIADNLGYLAEDYDEQLDCHAMAAGLNARLRNEDINSIFDVGLHEFIQGVIRDANALGRQIERDYRFYE
ncbi:MAG: alpha-E domain-containing protein, partial [Pseudomonadota bacterium]